jgi:hypothetical protein
METASLFVAAEPNIKTPRTASPLSSTTTTSLTASSTFLPPNPTITPAPQLLLDENGDIQQPTMKQKWHMTTYYTCLPRGATMNCGWHEPVLLGGDEIAAAPLMRRGERLAVGMGLGVCVIGVFGLW